MTFDELHKKLKECDSVREIICVPSEEKIKFSAEGFDRSATILDNGLVRVLRIVPVTLGEDEMDEFLEGLIPF